MNDDSAVLPASAGVEHKGRGAPEDAGLRRVRMDDVRLLAEHQVHERAPRARIVPRLDGAAKPTDVDGSYSPIADQAFKAGLVVAYGAVRQERVVPARRKPFAERDDV